MGIEDIEEKIKEKGKKEREGILEEAKEEIQEIKEEIEREAKQGYKREKREKRKELSAIPKRIISEAKMEERKKINAKKVQILDEVFEKAREKILHLPDKKKKKVLENLIQEERVENPTIYVDKEYSSLLPNKDVKEKEIGDFGVIMEDKEKSLRIDNTLSQVMERKRTQLEPKVARILFK